MNPSDLKTRLLSLLIEAENYRERLASIEREVRDIRNLVAGFELAAAQSAPPEPEIVTTE